MANRHGLSVRSLQRLLDRYIGVSPKWILQRFRLQEAAERIRQGGAADWSALAADLGYYDQAHFIRDFKSVVGQTPDAYARASEAGK
nr:helix-turn-helix domain-containing protein [Cohnella hashimotonis]